MTKLSLPRPSTPSRQQHPSAHDKKAPTRKLGGFSFVNIPQTTDTLEASPSPRTTSPTTPSPRFKPGGFTFIQQGIGSQPQQSSRPAHTKKLIRSSRIREAELSPRFGDASPSNPETSTAGKTRDYIKKGSFIGGALAAVVSTAVALLASPVLVAGLIAVAVSTVGGTLVGGVSGYTYAQASA